MNTSLTLKDDPGLLEFLNPTLIHPLEEFLNVPGKNIRPRLVELGYNLSCPDDADGEASRPEARLGLAQKIVELVHAGALIIDDVEDGSTVRRNLPTFHLKHGLPNAINSGNWLYFHALGLVSELGLPMETECQLLRRSLGYLTEAHCGQAIDLGVRIDSVEQGKVRDLCLSSMRLKTSTLLNLALSLGRALATHATTPSRELDSFGDRLGLLLQMFDDIGNFSAAETGHPSKRLEDLWLRRPCLTWAHAASTSTPKEYQEFLTAVAKLPDEQRLWTWVEKKNFLSSLRGEAFRHLRSLTEEARAQWSQTHPQSLEKILGICHLLEKAYG